MRTSRLSVVLPIPAKHALRKLGQDLRDASFVNRGLALVPPGDSPTSANGTRKPAASYTSTAASEPPAPQSASAPGGKLRA
jgi:hypothetical protein